MAKISNTVRTLSGLSRANVESIALTNGRLAKDARNQLDNASAPTLLIQALGALRPNFGVILSTMANVHGKQGLNGLGVAGLSTYLLVQKLELEKKLALAQAGDSAKSELVAHANLRCFNRDAETAQLLLDKHAADKAEAMAEAEAEAEAMASANMPVATVVNFQDLSEDSDAFRAWKASGSELTLVAWADSQEVTA